MIDGNIKFLHPEGQNINCLAETGQENREGQYEKHYIFHSVGVSDKIREKFTEAFIKYLFAEKKIVTYYPPFVKMTEICSEHQVNNPYGKKYQVAIRRKDHLSI